ncbi:hypothetical protein CAPTEDRAFT_211416 [Capitella teleta]|uniref:Uncharacterized protein n=1 Tax=Capitella teleta TaxID=283909 RepID=R7U231_CAPTE|nr:hypothetical protein CAPTEDRAFT_211416 [Capitella teleta]|eukprot:ELT97230.1 hypothetical protein CAPTEDRAFT_211416 [Capitella teleta]
MLPVDEEDEGIDSLQNFLVRFPDTDRELSRSPSPSHSLPTLSPGVRRRLRHRWPNGVSRTADALLGTSPPVSRSGMLRLAKDSTQPSSGSISDVRSEASVDEDDEEVDFFNVDMRPRARTCPEHQSWMRRARVRSMNRPPTPPPSERVDVAELMDKQCSIGKHRKQIHEELIPEVPEWTRDTTDAKIT